MRHVILLGSLAIGVAVACGSTSQENSTESADAGPDGDITLLPGTSSTATRGGAGTGLVTGLPCDVQAVLEDRCIACHASSSPPPLLTYEDLSARSMSSPTKTMAQLSLERLKSTASPMPPPPAEAPSATEIQAFEAWVNAGSPKGSACTDTPPGAAGAGAGDGGLDAGSGSKCTSATTWKDGNKGSDRMQPGTACNACHQQKGGPNLRIAGTVYPTAHEPDLCNGSAPPPTLTVVITDKNNKETKLSVNAAGNFFTRNKITPPYRATVTDGKKTRKMMGSVTAGDCNSCHTERGINGAPGRVMAP